MSKTKQEIIKASNALHTYFVLDIRPYAKPGFVKQIAKNKATYFTPKRVDSFR